MVHSPHIYSTHLPLMRHVRRIGNTLFLKLAKIMTKFLSFYFKARYPGSVSVAYQTRRCVYVDAQTAKRTDKIHFVPLLKCQAKSKSLSSCISTFVYGCNICLVTYDVNVSRYDENGAHYFTSQWSLCMEAYRQHPRVYGVTFHGQWTLL